MAHFCFITGTYSRYDVLMFERQGKSLAKAGFKVTYIVCDDLADEEIDGVHIKSTHFSPANRFERFFRTTDKVFELAQKVDADIYQLSDPEHISLVSKFKKIGKTVIFNMREFYPDLMMEKHYIPVIFRKLAAKGYEFLMKKYLHRYDAVFVVTDWIKYEVKRISNIDNIHILTNFPNVNYDFSLSYEDYVKRGNTLCYEGTVYQESRQENVFEALENIGNVSYIIAGTISTPTAYIKELPYWNNVKFIDGFKYSDLPEIFGCSSMSNVFRDFFGRDGSLGVIKVFESMEAALPVLLTDVPLYRSINEKYHCGICVNPNDVSSIESAIRYLVEHKEEAYQMGQNGRRAVIEEFNWTNQFEKYLDVINSVTK